MSYPGYVDSDQLSFLTKALDTFCSAHRVMDEYGRSEAAKHVMRAFANGATTYGEVLAALELDLGSIGGRIADPPNRTTS